MAKHVLEAEEPLLKNFLRGFADVAVTPSYADRDQAKRIRIAFPVVHRNRKFADDLLRTFQRLGVAAKPLEGVPEKRGPKGEKEHRIRVYAEDYEAIGFHFEHKQKILKVLAQWNLWKQGKGRR
ncbi:MAG: hypothetical protein RMJ82_06520 [Gemmatales bacterium]|nr:hypothetical protein [Gemmatales bacterium]